jgi:hypothetical protein
LIRPAIDRLAIASGEIQPDGDGTHPGIFLKLPASLDDVERTLRWLAMDGAQSEPPSSNDSSSRLD